MAKITLELEVNDLTATMFTVVMNRGNRRVLRWLSKNIIDAIKDTFERFVDVRGFEDFYEDFKWDAEEDPRAEDLNAALRFCLEAEDGYKAFIARTKKQWREMARKELAQWDIEEAEEQGE